MRGRSSVELSFVYPGRALRPDQLSELSFSRGGRALRPHHQGFPCTLIVFFCASFVNEIFLIFPSFPPCASLRGVGSFDSPILDAPQIWGGWSRFGPSSISPILAALQLVATVKTVHPYPRIFGAGGCDSRPPLFALWRRFWHIWDAGCISSTLLRGWRRLWGGFCAVAGDFGEFFDTLDSLVLTFLVKLIESGI